MPLISPHKNASAFTVSPLADSSHLTRPSIYGQCCFSLVDFFLMLCLLTRHQGFSLPHASSTVLVSCMPFCTETQGQNISVLSQLALLLFWFCCTCHAHVCFLVAFTVFKFRLITSSALILCSICLVCKILPFTLCAV